ncbi:MAG: hypothetical protein AB7P03_00925 [Kofleriaceae bacterium]
MDVNAIAHDEPTPPIRWAIAGGFAVAGLLAAASLAGIVVPSSYARETANWQIQAIAQDWFDLVIATPAICGVTLWARHSHNGLAPIVLGSA